MRANWNSFLTLLALLCLTTLARAGGSIDWDTVHTEIASQDKALLAFVDQTFDVARVGGCMRPTRGDLAGTRFAPYEFEAKPKGTPGTYTFILTFDGDAHSWSVSVVMKPKKDPTSP